ncbi:MAG: SpoIIIAH-like family protein [Bacillota bacterium]|uniref:SpoIIIAH-like family protein n=1 Tax=Virgibacillus salarius TaxID=447199 RepID=A0A941DWG4_9BACI|nr:MULTISPECIES: SpoIIIAH-like family protein [Bacillaceae]NAZ09457.1 SpoIIIAH-like family protein [Agaribacter marinus]MBR7796747.1 SpoIIIAH-like family protein [Virgibacillus salarius]MCC2249186.1 SpoIIIAH-like family protein [Virgibacillus sp. AGTR]MDY7043488.1 SpoIIIAH-like family protein [Virgibacillus sp. M23]QRZ16911.1 SpoIIIAH-like family protein [Virgibacillus sp. AGTR]
MLKKQTVWLLTMLSLMIVLSVYYMTSPDSEDIAYVNNGQDNDEEAVPTDSNETEGDAKVDEISNLGEDQLFTSLRMELEDNRSAQKERLTDIVASSSSTPTEKEQALEEIDVLENLSSKEKILEDSILASANYEDVLVRTMEDDEKVVVQLKVEEKLPKSQAVSIMQMVRDEIGYEDVDVSFVPSENSQATEENADENKESKEDQE